MPPRSTDYQIWLAKLLAECDDDAVDYMDQRVVNRWATRFNHEIASIVATAGEEATSKAVSLLYGCPGQIYYGVLDPALGPLRVEFMQSVKSLYQNCFLPHCSEYYSHLDRGPEPERPFNGICYMLWDLELDGHAINGDPEMLGQSLDVLSFALSLDSTACQESALHGLGHLAFKHVNRTTPIVEQYLERKDLSPELYSYAQAARIGYVL